MWVLLNQVRMSNAEVEVIVTKGVVCISFCMSHGCMMSNSKSSMTRRCHLLMILTVRVSSWRKVQRSVSAFPVLVSKVSWLHVFGNIERNTSIMIQPLVRTYISFPSYFDNLIQDLTTITTAVMAVLIQITSSRFHFRSTFPDRSGMESRYSLRTSSGRQTISARNIGERKMRMILILMMQTHTLTKNANPNIKSLWWSDCCGGAVRNISKIHCKMFGPNLSFLEMTASPPSARCIPLTGNLCLTF